MDELIYLYVKGNGWVPTNLNIYYDRNNTPFYVQIVDLPEIGDTYVVLYENQANPDWIRRHIARYSFDDRMGWFTESERLYYEGLGYKFAVLTRV